MEIPLGAAADRAPRDGGRAVGPRVKRPHLPQVDVLRILPMLAVVGVHATMFTQPANAVGADAVLVLLHLSRFAFFFITAFVLFYGCGSDQIATWSFWRRRVPPILLPYVAWTLIYWQFNRLLPWGGYAPTVEGALLQLGHDLVVGWYQLYFLLVTLQLYLAFPLLVWLVRRTREHHLLLLSVSAALELAWLVVVQYRWHSLPPLGQLLSSGSQWLLPFYQFFVVAGAVAAAHRDELTHWLRDYRRTLLLISLTLLASGLALYAFDLRLGQTPAQAAMVFQPSTVSVFLGGMLALGLLAQHLTDTREHTGRLWRFIRWASEISFGFFLAHMIALQFFCLPEVQRALGLDRLSTPLDGLSTWTLGVLGTVALVSVLRNLPFSSVLTGRPRRPRHPRLPVVLGPPPQAQAS
ncbi:MAG: acyltransferase [Candidatus Dormiibacterota bacterium]